MNPGERARKGWLRALYDWVLQWSGTPQASPALFVIAVAESSFFPIPPDVLLITMALARREMALRFAFLCSVGSVIGGMIGYGIGLQFLDWIGRPLLDVYGGWDSYHRIQDLYRTYDVWAVALAGFTPLPYKVFTIAAGAFRIDFLAFVGVSLLSRSARFFLIAWLVQRFGPPLRKWIERYFNWAALAFAVMLIGGFVLVKILF
ncbi:MAG: YqaA family protein [Acidobacteriota bacterium]|nr:DedA family protein [Acidobacteriota bacterium]